MKSDVECEFPAAYRLLSDFCVSHGIGYHDPSRDDVLPLHEALDAAWRRGVEEAAGVCERWHITKGGYSEMAHAIRALAAKGAHD